MAIKVICGEIVGIDITKLNKNQLHVCLYDAEAFIDYLSHCGKVNFPTKNDKQAWGLVKSHLVGITFDFANLGTVCKRLQESISQLSLQQYDDKTQLYLATDIESFFMFTESILDLMSIVITNSLILVGYSHNLGSIDSYGKLIKKFNKSDRFHPAIKVFEEPFRKSSQWFSDLKDIRDKLSHNAANPIVYVDKDKKVFFSINLGIKQLPIMNISQFHGENIFRVGETISYFLDCLISLMNNAGQILNKIYEEYLKCKIECNTAIENLLIPEIRAFQKTFSYQRTN